MFDKSDTLIDWLSTEIEERGWSIRQLAQRADLSPTTVGDVMGGRSRPGLQFCIGIARALQIAPEQVLRKAGLLPSIPPEVHEREELLHYFTGLPAADRERVVIFTRALHEQRTKYETEEDT